jgi:hypothetical protein
MKNLKIVIRKDLPETNSSSSHSIVINTKEVNSITPDSLLWDLKMDEDGFIHIPSTNSTFGREYEKFNSVLKKIQYACGLIRGENYEKLSLLQEILVEFTGCRGVKFDWLEEYYKALQETSIEEINEFGLYYCEYGPNVDHQSLDLEYDVWENKEVLKNFIFNSNSWLYLGDDGGYLDLKMQKELINPNYPLVGGNISIEFGGDIGKVDIPIQEFSESGEDVIGAETRLLECIIYKNGKFTSMTRNSDTNNSKILYYFPKKNLAFFSTEFNYPSIPETSRKLLWISDNVRNLWENESEKIKDNYINSASRSLRRGIPNSDAEYTTNLEETFRKIINDYQQEIVFVDYSIISEEFGEI